MFSVANCIILTHEFDITYNSTTHQRTTKKDVEDASGEREQECWFGEKGCHESSEIESGSWRDCWESGVNPATPIYRDKPGSIWID